MRGALAYGGGDGVAPSRGGGLSPNQQVLEELWGGLGLDQAAQTEADVPALVELDAPQAFTHPGKGAVGQVVEQRVLPRVEDDPLDQHVVEADAFAQPGAAGCELDRHLRQPFLEELEHPGRSVSPGGCAPLVRGASGQAEHLLGDAVEEYGMTLLVAALQEEHPGHQRLVGGHRGLLGRCCKRRDLLGDDILGHAEAGQ